MKSKLKDLIVAAGAHRLVKRGYGGLGSILMFHRIQSGCALSPFGASSRGDVTPEAFAAMIDALHEEGIEIVPLDEALARLAAPHGSRPFVSLTFDDGYRDNYDQLWPIVCEREIPVTIYVTPGFIDRTAPMWWYGLDAVIARHDRVALRFTEGERTIPARTLAEKESAFAGLRQALLTASAASRATALASMSERYDIDFPAIAEAAAMTWDMVRELAGSGLVEIGAHTSNHPPLATLSVDDAYAEIRRSKERLEEEIGRPVRHFAFPYGDATTTGVREIELAARAGLVSATTTRQGALFAAHSRTPHALPRFPMGADDSPVSLKIKLSGLPVALRRPLRPMVTEPAR